MPKVHFYTRIELNKKQDREESVKVGNNNVESEEKADKMKWVGVGERRETNLV